MTAPPPLPAAHRLLNASREEMSEADVHAVARYAVEAEKALRRAVYIAEHLFQMVPRQVWRDSGGDDGQGHYEGDYHAEQVREELAALSAAGPAGEHVCPDCHVERADYEGPGGKWLPTCPNCGSAADPVAAGPAGEEATGE